MLNLRKYRQTITLAVCYKHPVIKNKNRRTYKQKNKKGIMNGFTSRISRVAILFTVAMVSILLACFALFAAPKASAAPTTMNFQGRLSDATGNTMPDGLYNMQFRLFTVSSGGSATWTETRETTNRVQVTNGLFSTQLGAVTPITASLFSGNDVYFEITMPTPGTATCGTASCASWESPMTPRHKMATSAYAFQAENANTLDGLDSTAFAAASGSANYLQNGTSPQTADFNITGTGTAATLQATTFDRAAAGALTIGGTNATSIVLGDNTTVNANLTVAAGNSLTLTGGNTASRPGSPSEGMLYFDSETNELLQYNGTKWVSDRSSATKIVAPSTASQALKDSADYVADGTGDQTEINAALTAAAGGKVYLIEGTYYISAAISIANNTTLAGAGSGTIIAIPNAQNGTYSMIVNTDITTGTGVTVRDLAIDGNKANQTGGYMYAMHIENLGNDSAGRAGGLITNVDIKNIRGDGLWLETSEKTSLMNNRVTGIGAYGFYIDSSNYNMFTNNTASANEWHGFGVYGNNNTLTGNTASSNPVANGFEISGNNNTITANSGLSNASYGFSVSGTSNVFTGNTAKGNTAYGVWVSGSSHIVSNNVMADNGFTTTNNGLYLFSADSNTITGNYITDTAATVSNYAINISNAGSDNNYLADNRFSSTPGTATIRDIGTGTRFVGQTISENGLDVRFRQSSSTSAFQIQNASSVSVFNVDTTTNNITLGAATSLTLTGGNTASRPATPVEGMVYYDSETKQLLTYANGKWQADRSDAILVAANNSSNADKAAADYIADGTADQTEINNALTAASGKKIVLLAGNYSASATIFIPNNTTLAGIGMGTVLEFADIDTTDNLIENTDNTTGTGVTVRDMKIDGRNDVNLAGAQVGIFFNDMGTAASDLEGASLKNLTIQDFRADAIKLDSSDLNTVSNVNIINAGGTGGFGMTIQNSSNQNKVTQNTFKDSITGLQMALGESNIISDNTFEGNTNYGIYSSADKNNISSNTFKTNSYSIYLDFSSFNNVSNNVITDTTNTSVNLTSSHDNIISGNNITDGGGATTNMAISLSASDRNSIQNNKIFDSSASTTNYAIRIVGATADNTYLSGNVFRSTPGTSTISDAGTGTNYVSQPTAENGLDTLYKQTASTIAFQIQNASSSPIFNVDTTNGRVGIGVATPSAALTVAQSSQGSQYGLLVTEGGQDRIKAYTSTGGETYFDLYDNNTFIRQTNANGHLHIQSGRAINFNTSDTGFGGYAFKLQGTDTFNIGNAGEVVFENFSNSAAAFKVQNATNVSLFNIDTTNNRIVLGTSDTTGVLLVLDTKTDAGDPTGTDGAMYYNSSMARFRCYESGAWKNCTGANPTNGSTATQGVSAGADTYVTGSDLLLPTGGLQGPTSGATNGTKITWKVVMSKTAAGTAASTFTLRMGTNGTTADSSRCTFSTGTATAAVDGATVYITAYTTAGGASSTLNCSMSLTHQLPDTGFADAPVVQTYSTAGSADSTTAGTKMGLSFNAGTSSVITIQSVEVTSTNL
jgi:parallel beta-helix repeat protein